MVSGPIGRGVDTLGGFLLFHMRGNKTRGLVDTFVFGGASVYIPTTYGVRGSRAGNFGGGVNLWFSKHTALRLEFRDYVKNNAYDLQPAQNYASFRVGVTFRWKRDRAPPWCGMTDSELG